MRNSFHSLLPFAYLLRFSDRIDRLKNSRQFLYPITIANRLSYMWERVSSNQKPAVKMNQSVRNAFTLKHVQAPLQSSFTEFCRVSTRFTPVFSQISYKPQTAESSNRFIALEQEQEQQNIDSGKNPRRR